MRRPDLPSGRKCHRPRNLDAGPDRPRPVADGPAVRTMIGSFTAWVEDFAATVRLPAKTGPVGTAHHSARFASSKTGWEGLGPFAV